MIYLVSPYSHEDESIRLERYEDASHVTAELMARGQLVFSPIAYSHPLATRCDLPLGWDYWQKFDKAMLAACDSLWVLCLDGWMESVGVQAEIELARAANMHITYTTMSAFIPRRKR